ERKEALNPHPAQRTVENKVQNERVCVGQGVGLGEEHRWGAQLGLSPKRVPDMLVEKRHKAGVPDVASQNLKRAEELGAVKDQEGNNKNQQHRQPFEVLPANRRSTRTVRAGRRVPAEM